MVSAVALAAAILAAPSASADIPQPLDRTTAITIAVERSRGATASRATAAASRTLAKAEGRLPDPEVSAEAWQVPALRPLAFGDASMISFWLRQTIPAPGTRASRSEVREGEAEQADAVATDRARTVAREAAHAFVDVQMAEARHASHVAHRDVAERIVALAEARLGTAGGRAVDVSSAQVERAKLDADVALEARRIERAHAKLNGLLWRPLDASLVTVSLGDPEGVTLDRARAFTLAAAHRPELRQVRARLTAAEASMHAERREATLPTFTVGAGYFVPTSLMPSHGYGFSASATLPWIWGSASDRARAASSEVLGATHEEAELENAIRTESATALAEVQAATARLAVLRSRAKPAADAALGFALTAYQSGQGDATALLRAERDLVEIDIAIVEARAELAHSLAELDWVLGTPPPRVAVVDAERGLGASDEGGAR